MESWAPPWVAWERDNVGLQVGDRSKSVRQVLVALELTEGVLAEASSLGAELIITHHPLLFRPPAAIVAGDPVGDLVLGLASRGISLFSAHTNLDFTRDGVSFALAENLGLSTIRFLKPLQGIMTKLVVFVPEAHVDALRKAMAQEGAGMIGEYTECSFAAKGTGTFMGSERARPSVGTKQKLEHVPEVRLEMLVPRGRTAAVVRAMTSAHPYEEVAYDLYELQNDSPDFGMGAIGELPHQLPLAEFLDTVKQRLETRYLRVSGRPERTVHRVAVCGGSGSELLEDALRAGADALVTADVKYHAFHAAADRLALIDAGHWETERVVIPNIAARIRAAAEERGEQLSVATTKQSTNPVRIV